MPEHPEPADAPDTVAAAVLFSTKKEVGLASVSARTDAGRVTLTVTGESVVSNRRPGPPPAATQRTPRIAVLVQGTHHLENGS